MQLIIEGDYFGAASKFQQAIKQHSQAFRQADISSLNYSSLNAYGEFGV
jgi:hypothetical protein